MEFSHDPISIVNHTCFSRKLKIVFIYFSPLIVETSHPLCNTLQSSVQALESNLALALRISSSCSISSLSSSDGGTRHSLCWIGLGVDSLCLDLFLVVVVKKIIWRRTMFFLFSITLSSRSESEVYPEAIECSDQELDSSTDWRSCSIWPSLFSYCSKSLSGISSLICYTHISTWRLRAVPKIAACCDWGSQ